MDGKRAYYWSVLIVCLSFYVFRSFTYGLETGIYLTAFALVVLYSINLLMRPDSMRGDVWLGVLIGIAGLSRIDFGLVVAVALAGMLFFCGRKLVSVFVIGFVALLIVSPWFVWVYSVSGSWLPSSGPAQSSLIDQQVAFSRLAAMSAAFIQNVTVWIYTGGRLEALLISVVGVSSLVLYSALIWGGMDQFRSAPLRLLGCWTIGAMMLFPVYMVLFWATHFYARYTAPISVIAIVSMSGLLAQLKSRNVSYLIFCTVVLFNSVFAFLSLHTGRVGNSHAVTAGFVMSKLPPSRKVGAFQSGVIGYFNENVVNLDGKINSSALRALRDKSLPVYLLDSGVEFIVDWGEVDEGKIAGIPAGQWKPCPERIPNGMSVCLMK